MEKTYSALITGGGSGIGFAFAKDLLAAGHKVVAVGRRAAKLQEATELLPGLITFVGDVSTPEGVIKIAEWVRENQPEMNLLIQNAGLQHPRGIDSGIEAFEDMSTELTINVLGPAMLTNALYPELVQNKATLVYVTSGLAYTPRASVMMYSATKAALHSLALSQRFAFATHGVRVMEVAPPLVNSDFHGPDYGIHPNALFPEDVSKAFMEGLANGTDDVLVGFAAMLAQQREAALPMVNSL